MSNEYEHQLIDRLLKAFEYVSDYPDQSDLLQECALYLAKHPPTKREWQLLTDEEITDAANSAEFKTMVTADDYIFVIARAIEAKLKEKNNG